MRKYKLIFVLFLSIAMIFSLSACTDVFSVFFVTNSTNVDTISDYGEVTGTVTVSIIYPEEAELENTDGKASIYEKNKTVLNALSDFCALNGIDITIETGVSSYVTSIGGVSENDFGDSCGWVYTVNGEEVWEAADKCELEDGDIVEWKFVDFSGSSF